MTDTEWTPEKRKTREEVRAALVEVLAEVVPFVWEKTEEATRVMDRLYPAPPPEYTYGREVDCPTTQSEYSLARRRSDGEWERKRWADGAWEVGASSDDYIRALAAEVPLTDKECDEILNKVYGCGIPWSDGTRDKLRTAFARVMRGEVK